VEGLRLGMDLGSVTVGLVVLGPDGEVLLARDRPVRGAPVAVAAGLLREAAGALGPEARVHTGITGIAAPALAAALGGAGVEVNEVVATAAGVGAAMPAAATILDLGGQFSKWILVDREAPGLLGRVKDFSLNGLCAAGAGAFLDQQASRLRMELDELAALAAGAARGAAIAGRCSVFAKSDMIHLQQKGTPSDEIAYGLCLALARTFASTVLQGRVLEAPVAVVGGGASNPGLVRALREVLGLDGDRLVVPEGHRHAGARGAAVAAPAAPLRTLAELLEPLDRGGEPAMAASPGVAGPGLRPGAPRIEALDDGGRGAGASPRGHLGIDVGSVSTNVVLLSPDLELLEAIYVPTRGRPVEALDQALGILEERLHGAPLEVLSAGTTGSGRHLAGRLVGADLVRNEITAQLASAARYIPDLDTVFEIGGQDSKYIDAPGGRLRGFEMNRICAAGTGSFLEEQSERLGISIVGEFGALGLRSAAPVDLGSRCTVFMDTELCRALERGVAVEDLCGGLALAVARNYLEKVVAGREVGMVVVFQGGTSANEAVVEAFRKLLGRPVRVHPHGRVSGAIGAALLAARAQPPKTPSRFLGLRACRDHKVTSFPCAACANRCQVNVVDVAGRRAHFGDVCERYTARDGAAEGAAPKTRAFPELFAARAALLEEHLPRPTGSPRPQVGLVRGSLFLEHLPFWATFLDALGFDPVLSPPGASAAGSAGLPGEVCLPLKRAASQVQALLELDGVDRVLLPAVSELERRHGRDRPCTCLYAHHLGDLSRLARGARVLTPQLGLSRNPGVRREAVRALAAALEVSAAEADRAWVQAMECQEAFVGARRRLGAEALAALDRPALVVLGKPYNLHDPAVNLGLARHLDRAGLPAIPMDLLPLEGEVLGEEWYMLPWQLSRDQVRALQAIAPRGDLYPLHVSSYGCGPDAFTVKHLERAWGKRPMLLLEFDEHQGEAGLVTRLEAFADEIASHGRRTAAPLRRPSARDNLDLPPGTRCHLPWTSPHVHAYAGALRAAGLEARILPPPDTETLRLGDEVASGRECHPYAILAGDLAKLVRGGGLRSGDRFFLPSTRMPCLLSQYGDGFRRLLEDLGETRLRVFDQHPGEATALFGARGMIALYEGLTLVDFLIVAGCRLRPREEIPGAVDAALGDCYRLVEERGAALGSARACMKACRALLESVPVGSGKPRPLVGVTGDLYTRISDAGNASLVRRLEEHGCTVWPSPFFGATSDFELPQNARRSRARGEWRKSLRETATAALLRSRARSIASALPPELRSVCVEPPERILQGYATQYVGADASHLVRSLVAKMADFAARGADGVISAVGLGCMVGITAAATIPAIRRDHGDLPVVSIAYGGVEGPAQHIRLETFIHQAKQHFERRAG